MFRKLSSRLDELQLLSVHALEFSRNLAGEGTQLKHVSSPYLFTHCIAVVCGVCVYVLEKLEKFCCLGCFLKVKPVTLILF